MTACFVVQHRILCLAAADTRLSITNESGHVPTTSDLSDIHISDQVGNSIFVPYRYRKIRRVGRGWAVAAGTFISGKAMLDLLSAEEAFEIERAKHTLQNLAPARLVDLESTIGGACFGSDGSRIIGVSVDEFERGAWVADYGNESGYLVSPVGNFGMNWPSSIPALDQDNAQTQFFEAVENLDDIGDAIRGAAALIGAARAAPDCSQNVQIGLTVHDTPTEFHMRYLEGPIDEILSLTNEQIRMRWEILA